MNALGVIIAGQGVFIFHEYSRCNHCWARCVYFSFTFNQSLVLVSSHMFSHVQGNLSIAIILMYIKAKTILIDVAPNLLHLVFPNLFVNP